VNAGVSALRAEVRDTRAVVMRRLAEATAVGLDTASDRARVALALHHAYVALESLLERTIRFFDEGVPTGSDSHRALLHRAGLEVPELRPALLSGRALSAARELLKFRHFLHHDYGADLEAAPLARLQDQATGLAAVLPADLDALDAWLGALSAEG